MPNSTFIANFKRPASSRVRYFNAPSGTANFFDLEFESLDGYSPSDGITKKALVAVEGTFDDSNGVAHAFSPQRLETIAAHTNAAIDSGNTIPVCQDHSKTVDSTVGSVNGHAYVKPVEVSDLPNPKSTHLIGKMGLFLEDVHIKASDAVSKVANGIVTSVSMGLNLDPKEHRIMELSLVPIPAIPNMGLFKHKATASFMQGTKDDSQAFTWEDMEADALAMEELKEEYDDLGEQLWRLLDNIYTSDAINITDMAVLRQYVYNALNGYSIRVLDLLGLNEQADSQTDALNQAAAMDATALQQQQAVQRQDISQPSMNAPYSKGNEGLINFRKPALYLR